jgi:hypothetical protein
MMIDVGSGKLEPVDEGLAHPVELTGTIILANHRTDSAPDSEKMMPKATGISRLMTATPATASVPNWAVTAVR